MRCKGKVNRGVVGRCGSPALRGSDWCARHGPDEAQAERLAHKEAAKGREVVDCVMRVIIPGAKHVDHSRVIECAVQCTRDELATLQAAHAKDGLLINYIREDK